MRCRTIALVTVLSVATCMGAGASPASTVDPATYIMRAMRAASQEEQKNSLKHSETNLLEGSSSLLRGSTSAEQMQAIRANMNRLHSMRASMQPQQANVETNATEQDLRQALVAESNHTNEEHDELERGTDLVADAVQTAKKTLSAGGHHVSQMTMKQVLKHQASMTEVLKHLDSTQGFLKKQLEAARAREAHRLSSTTTQNLEAVVNKLLRKRIDERLDGMNTAIQQKISDTLSKEVNTLAARVEDVARTALRKNVELAVKEELQKQSEETLEEDRKRKMRGATGGATGGPPLTRLIEDRVNSALDTRLKSAVDSEVMNATTGLDGLRLTEGELAHGFADMVKPDQTKWKTANHSLEIVQPGSSDAELDPKNVKRDVNGKPDFRYSVTGGYSPSNWGRISPEYATCGSGREQSPISIQTPTDPKNVKTGNVHVRPELPAIQVAYETFNAGKIIHNGHAPMIGFPAGRNGTLVYDGETFEYKQFHIHSPGEHATNGNRPAMSFNLVHESSKVHEGMNTRFAMVNVNFEISSDGEPFLGTFFDRLPSPPAEGSTEPTYVSLDDVKLSLASALFDAPEGQAWMKIPSSSFYTYHGSLTTPPCTENVKYFLMKQPLRVTEEQVRKLRTVLPDRENARPIMNSQWAETPTVYTQSIEKLAPRTPPTLVHATSRSPPPQAASPAAPAAPAAPTAPGGAPDYSNAPERFKEVAGAMIANNAAADENLRNAATSATEVLNELA